MLKDFSPDFQKLIGAKTASQIEEYGRFHQHLALLEDYARVAAYLEAVSIIPRNRGVVLDVGAGTGIWGLVALRCGFDHAFLVEPSRKMCEYCRYIAAKNGLSERITILNTAAEQLDLSVLPESLDLVVTETMSSLLFGFGSWDILPAIADRLKSRSEIIPVRGRLFAAITHLEFGKQQGRRSGIRLIESLGLVLDIGQRTFHSAGNVLEKDRVLWEVNEGELQPVCLASFDFAETDGRPEFHQVSVHLHPGKRYGGLLLYWTLDLSCHDPRQRLSSLDPGVTSWYPLYVPLRAPILVESERDLNITLEMQPRDYPYKYAFQFIAEGKPITSTLYW